MDASCPAGPDRLIAAGIAQNIERWLREDGQNDDADQFKGQVRWQMQVLHGGGWGGFVGRCDGVEPRQGNRRWPDHAKARIGTRAIAPCRILLWR